VASLGGAASGGKEAASLGKVLSGGKVASLGKVMSGGKVASADEAASLGKVALVSGSTSGRGVASSGGVESLDGAAVSVGSQMTLAEASKADSVEVMAHMRAAGRERDGIIASIVAAREAHLQMPWPPAAAGATLLPGNEEMQTMAPLASILDTVADLFGKERSVTRTPMTTGVLHTLAMPPP